MLIGLGATILFFYVGCEVATGGYLYTYAVDGMEMSGSAGDYITSVYWGMLAVGRFLAIFFALRFSPAQMLVVNLLGCLVGTVIIIAFLQSQTALWVGIFVYGLSMSSIFPTVMTLVEESVNLTGKITTALVVIAACGEMVLPMTIALMFRDPEIPFSVLFYFNLGWGVLELAALGAFVLLARRKSQGAASAGNGNGAGDSGSHPGPEGSASKGGFVALQDMGDEEEDLGNHVAGEDEE